jgi:hypothetical protein
MGNGLIFVVRPNSQIRLAESSIAADFPIISPAGRLAGLEAVIQKVAADTLRRKSRRQNSAAAARRLCNPVHAAQVKNAW